MTKRLYYQDPYLFTFQANVIEKRELHGQAAVILDATAFYPTGGGQPHDTGTLNDTHVLDVQVTEDSQIVHVLDRPLNDTFVHGKIDEERRLDHMQQHTGQHILSQAFVQTCGAETVGFHLGEGISTIDLDRAPLSTDMVARAERLANKVALGNHRVTARFVDRSELETIPLRKMPVVEGPIRIVQISQFDWSPCGGTHVNNSGQVGPIKVTRIERRKAETRVYFLCGWRALADYEHKHDIVQALAAHFTTSESEVISSVLRMEDQTKDLRKALIAAQRQLLEFEIADWTAQAQVIGQMRVVRLAFDERDPSLLREIARRLTDQASTIALLATRQPRAQFVFARSEDSSTDMGKLIRVACASVGGRGGGRPQLAQGGAPEGSSVDRVLDKALEQLKSP